MSSEIVLHFEDLPLVDLFGEKNKKLKILAKAFPELSITARGSKVKIIGQKKQTQKAKAKLELLAKILIEQGELSLQTVEDVVIGDNPYSNRLSNGSANQVIVHGRTGKPIRAKTENQKKLVTSSESNDVVFAVGPAGTGKTYTAVALAVRALKNRIVRKIILTRPAVEAGENLGFLPGDLKEKIDPYLRPLYDALDDMFPAEKLVQFMENRTIEIAPLAFMRGRTLDNAFIILDEAQNATSLQLKMFLTRLGPLAKCIITGDLTQVDLPYQQKSGLYRSMKILDGVEGIAQVKLNSSDVVRHRLVRLIINAYESDDNRRNKQKHKEEE